MAPGGTEHLERAGEEHALWEGRTRVFLQPVAAPSILGLFGLAGALMMVGAWQAGWYGNAATPLVVFPFVLTFGGLAQFLSGMWSYRARDGLATAMHGMWGAFWLAWGLLFLVAALGALPLTQIPLIGAASSSFAFWFVVLTVITALGAVAALGQNLGLAATLAVLAVASGFTAAGFFAGATWAQRIGGWLFVISSVIALYTAAAMMFENSFGRTVLPLGRHRAAAHVPGSRDYRPLEYRYGQPGVKIGQ
ncbi:acetate uptake transporter family protein [Thermomonospora echinospora]|nr:GPR1/FUN34/YaaH family transporter [Thermomonospora echinospora]